MPSLLRGGGTIIKFVDDDTLYEYDIRGELNKTKLYELGLIDGDSNTSQWIKQPQTVSIGKTVTSIGDYAFLFCEQLVYAQITDNVTKIGEGTFSGCSDMTTVMIGNGVTSIGNDAFRVCGKFTDITLPVCVTTVGEDAFENTPKLNIVNIVLNGKDDDNLDNLKQLLISAGISESATWNIIQPTA